MFLIRRKDKEKKDAKDSKEEKAKPKDLKDDKRREKDKSKDKKAARDSGTGDLLQPSAGVSESHQDGSGSSEGLSESPRRTAPPQPPPKPKPKPTFTSSLRLELKKDGSAADGEQTPGSLSEEGTRGAAANHGSVKAVVVSLQGSARPSSGKAPSVADAADAMLPTGRIVRTRLDSGRAGGSGGDRESIVNITMSIQPPPSEPPLSPTQKSYSNVRLELPAIVPPKPSRVRQLTLKRTPKGDFGFSLRRGTMVERGGSGSEEKQKPVVFAEPGVLGMRTGLLPGDRLVEVNGVNVEDKSREDVVSLIRSAVDSLVLRVQPVPELSELSLRTAGFDQQAAAAAAESAADEDGRTADDKSSDRGHAAQKARSEDEVASEKLWHDSESMWLVHKGGYSACVLLKRDGAGSGMLQLPEGRCRVKLEHSGDVLEVDEMDLEKRNPPGFDRAEDIATLVHLNESSVIHTLRQRYGSSLIHSYAGPALLVFNPMQPVNLYSDKVIQMFRGCKQQDVPPHIYASAQLAYRSMLGSRRNQSIVLTGRSGSGKTTNLKYMLQYFAVAYGGTHSNYLVEKLNASMVLLEAFGNSRTVLNTNASRFAQLTSVEFDAVGLIASISLQVLFLERTRITRRPEGEPSFHIFYYLLSGAEGQLKNDLFLGNQATEPNLFMTPVQRPEDRQKAAQNFQKVESAMKTLAITVQEVKVMLCTLAAIYHLGVAGVTKGANNKPYFLDPAAGQKAASLLGTTIDDLTRAIFSPASSSTGATLLRPSASSPEKPEDKVTGLEALEGFVVGLYSEVFNAVVSLINRSLSSSSRTVNSILILDEPGLQNPAAAAVTRQAGATFEDLCYNYVQERLQLFFHTIAFMNQLDRYAQENIVLELDEVGLSPQPMVDLLDKSSPASNLGRSTGDLTLMNDDSKGLLWLLDEESLLPGACDEQFVEKLGSLHDGGGSGKCLVRLDPVRGTSFTLLHQQGTAPVQYDAFGWLKASRENPACRQAISVLIDSNKSEMCEMFSRMRVPALAGGGGGSSSISTAADASGGLRRSASMRRALVSQAGVKRRSLAVQLKYQMDSVIETLQKTKAHFVFNMMPQASAGLSSLRGGGGGEDMLLAVPLVREQLRCMQILPAVRHHRQGYPEYMTFTEFCQTYNVLSPSLAATRDTIIDQKKAVENILSKVDSIDHSKYRIGLSQVFFRYGVLAQLNDVKEVKRSRFAVVLQSYLRRYLAQKLLKRLKVQQTALLCIQRNIRKYIDLKDWQWWKLYIKVKPVLNVHRMEDELKSNTAVLEELQRKVEKLEKERSGYKADCERLEATLGQTRDDYTEERRTASQATELLESEMSKRMLLEKDLKELQARYNECERHQQKLETELMQSRVWEASAQDDLDEPDNDDAGSRIKYERLQKEAEFGKMKLQQEHAQELEQLASLKHKQDKQLHEALMERDELQAQMVALRRKLQRAGEEQLDLRHHLDDSLSRNAELEKKQRKFDAETQSAAEELEESRQAKDKLQKERDRLLAEKYTCSRELEGAKAEVDTQLAKIKRLEREMADFAQTSTGDGEVVSLKRSKHELETRLAELDDELSELQQENADLNNAKLRLQMDQEKTRQKYSKDIEELEKDMEELKNSSAKKIRTMENKVEEFEDEIRGISADKRNLEKQLQEAVDFAPKRDQGEEKRLRAELKHAKALLADAQLLAGKRSESISQKSNVRTLQAQLEDAHSSLSAALRGKKSVELELAESQVQLERIGRQKMDTEERLARVVREKASMENDKEDTEEEVDEVMKKYQTAVTQSATDIMTIKNLTNDISQLNEEKRRLQEENEAALSKIQHFETTFVSRETVTMLELKLRDAEQKLDLEKTMRSRLEGQNRKLKDQHEKLSDELGVAVARALAEERSGKQLQAQLSRLMEELEQKSKSSIDASQNVKRLEQSLEYLETEKQQLQADLALAQQRIEHLSTALQSTSSLTAPDSDELDTDDAFQSSDDD